MNRSCGWNRRFVRADLHVVILGADLHVVYRALSEI